ncbi:MAG: hypothetical protein ACQESP_07050 [Candidatus Muiribacteriota bacterium]
MIKTISYYTFLSIMKKKGWVLFLFFILFNFFSYFYINTLSEYFVPQIFLMSNISFFNILSAVIAIMWCYSEIGVDIKDKKIYVLLGSGVRSHIYYAGKYSGILLALFLNAFMVYILLAAQTLYYGESFAGILTVFFVYLLRFSSFCILFAGINLVLNFISAVSLSFFSFMLSQLIYLLGDDITSGFKNIFTTLLPSEIYYGEVERAFYSGINVPFDYVFFLILYTLAYSYIVYNIFSWLFNKREL